MMDTGVHWALCVSSNKVFQILVDYQRLYLQLDHYLVSFTGKEGRSPTVTVPEIMSERRLIMCNGTLITPISTPCSSTLTPVKVLSENGNTLSKLKDWVAPVSLRTLICNVSWFPLRRTKALDTKDFLLHPWGTIFLSPQHPPIIQSDQQSSGLSNNRVLPFGSFLQHSTFRHDMPLFLTIVYSRLGHQEIVGSTEQVHH